jgi:hypothetical protein
LIPVIEERRKTDLTRRLEELEDLIAPQPEE